MKVWPALLASALLVAAVVRCGGVRPKAALPEDEAVAADGAPGAAGAPSEDASTDAGPAAPEPPRPDPALVKKALDRSGTSDGAGAETHGLRFELVENGPRSGWALALVNRGTETLRVNTDPSLLTIEVLPPPDPKASRWAKPKKARVCKLPPELASQHASERFRVVLRPGHGIVEAFDPRLYCLPEQGVSPFVAGAKVSARFGFAPKTKVVWKGGRHEELLPEQPPPFVAVVTRDDDHDPEDDHDGGWGDRRHGDRPGGRRGHGDHDHGRGRRDHGHDRGHGDHERGPGGLSDAGASDAGALVGDAGSPAEREPKQGVKELRATPVELGSDYAPPVPEKVDTLALELVQGSDAAARASVTVTFKLTNHEKIARRIYVRRELVSFQVTGPDGTLTCDPQPDERAPDRLAFTQLAPGGSISLTSRLTELCAEDAFQRPGLYVVEGQLDAFARGDDYGFDAFVGKLVSPRAVVVRVRSGTLPFPGPRVVERVRVGAP